LIAEDKGILENGDNRVPAYLKGVDSNFSHVSGVAGKVETGTFDLGTSDQPMAVLGVGLENILGIEADRALLPLGVFLFRRGAAISSLDPMASLAHETMVTAGTFRIEQDFDDHYVITNLDFVRRMIGLGPDEYTAVEFSLDDPTQAVAVGQTLIQLLGKDFHVQTRYEQNQNLYNVMRTEKWVIYILLTLILVVAAFNMVGALTMLVWEKQKDIYVLKALGANDRLVRKIFLTEGLLLAVMGGMGGILLAVIICWLQIKYHLIPLQGGSFLINYYPVKLVATDFLLVFVTIGVVALLASWIPATKAASQPIDLKT